MANISSCLRMFAAPSILKFLPIRARSLIFFSLSAFRFKPLSSAASGSATRVLPRTIINASPFNDNGKLKRFRVYAHPQDVGSHHDPLPTAGPASVLTPDSSEGAAAFKEHADTTIFRMEKVCSQTTNRNG